MSHFTRIRTRLSDREMLVKALTDLGYPVEEGPAVGYGHATIHAEVRIPQRGGYAIGFARGDGGVFDVVGDFEMIVPRVDVPSLLVDVTRRYAYHATRQKLEAQGFNLVEEEVGQDGRVHMLLRRMA